MKRIATAASLFALGASAASAGGVERTTQSTGILFEEGRYAELNWSFGSPDVSGTGPSLTGGITGSGDMGASYNNVSLGYKQALTDSFDFAIVVDQPIGADVAYPIDNGYILNSTTAELSSLAITALMRYEFPSHVSLIGGVRAQSVEGDVSIFFPPSPIGRPYVLSTDRDYSFGYVLGAAWERPDIAARIALTYNSAIDHTLESTENGIDTGGFDTTIPQSVNLEFQSGIAPDTLLFGSIRWVDWSEFAISPTLYLAGFGGDPLVAYESDRITYNLGIGRKFNESWSGAITIAYEPSNGDETGNLGPVDGYRSIGLAATYTRDNMEITGGVRYMEIGGATTSIGAEFEDNNAIGAGLRLAFTF